MTNQSTAVATTETPTKPPLVTKSSVDIAQALHLRLDKGLSLNKISKLMNVPWTTFYEAVKPVLSLIENPERLEAFRQHKSSLIGNVQALLVESMSDKEKLKKASINNLAYAFGQMDNAYRLEQGQATANIAIKLSESEHKVISQYVSEAVSEEIRRQWAGRADDVVDISDEELERLQNASVEPGAFSDSTNQESEAGQGDTV